MDQCYQTGCALFTTSLSAKFCSEVLFTEEFAIYHSSCVTNVVFLTQSNLISQPSQNITHNTWCCGLVPQQLPWMAHIFFTGLLKSPHMEQCWRCGSHQSWDPQECWMTCGCSMMAPHPLHLSSQEHFSQTFFMHPCSPYLMTLDNALLRHHQTTHCCTLLCCNEQLALSCGRLSPSLLYKWTAFQAWWPTCGWTLRVKTQLN